MLTIVPIQGLSEDGTYAKAVVDYYIGGSENGQKNPNDALGPEKEQSCNNKMGLRGYVSLGGGYIILDMGENQVILDEIGNDLIVFEVGNDNYPCGNPENYEVYVSNDLNSWKFVGEGKGTFEFDINSTGFDSARYVKVKDGTDGVSKTTPGADIDAIKALHSGKQNPLILTKIVTPQSIKQNQTATMTLTVKNTGSTEIRDIEIADTIPSYITFIEGETSKLYDSLAPKDARQISYTLQFNDAGTFNFEPAIATYADDKGNYNTVESKPASIEVIRSIIENSAPTPKPTNSNVNSASVNLHGEKTDVALGEDVLLKLSAVNIIGNPAMHVQVIIIPPSGWSVTSSEFAKSGAGQYTTTYELESGGGKDIEVRIVPNQIGDDFQVEGRIVYYFGDDVGTREDHSLSLPIKVQAKSVDASIITNQSNNNPKDAPGFGLIFAIGSLVLVWYIQLRGGKNV